MLEYIARRVMDSVPVLLGISLVVFGVMHWLPGDPVAGMLYESAVSEEAAAQLREQLGLNDPPIVQYGRFLAGAVRGDLGRSLVTRRPVVGEILINLPSTLQLALVSLLLATIAGVILGIVSALCRDSWLDQIIMSVSLVGVSMPLYWSGLLLILLFAVRLGWLPVTSGGRELRGLILPALTLAFWPAAIVTRLTRASMLEILPQDYIRTARAKGLNNRIVVVRHALRNALIPIVTVVGVQVGMMLSGTVVAETVFTRPGIGTLIITGIKTRDYPVVQGAVLYVSVIYVFINLVVDLTYGLIDPRIRVGGR